MQVHPKDMCVAAVTGTNGKSSCAVFYAQALAHWQRACVVIGTLGAGVWPDLHDTGMTTPDAKQLRALFSQNDWSKTPYMAIEASSHGLVQKRLAELSVRQAVLTNITHDHLDYHGSWTRYVAAKQLLFDRPELQWRIFNHDDAVGRMWLQRYAGETTLAYGWQTAPGLPSPDVCVEALRFDAQGFEARLCTPWGDGQLRSGLLGRFNVSNVLAVTALLGALPGLDFDDILAALHGLSAVSGRLQSFTASGAPRVVVDYAHTPDALRQVLASLRPWCVGQLWCVFGCGGGRDQDKRPQMGACAEACGDHVVLTDDNPRLEDPEAIAADIQAGMQHSVRYIPDRAQAIAHAIDLADAQDVILVAGKGHEKLQHTQAGARPFDDREVVQALLNKRSTSGCH